MVEMKSVMGFGNIREEDEALCVGGLQRTFLDAVNARLLSMGRDGCIVCRCILRSPTRRDVSLQIHLDATKPRWRVDETTATYGADCTSSFLLRMGSDIMSEVSKALIIAGVAQSLGLQDEGAAAVARTLWM